MGKMPHSFMSDSGHLVYALCRLASDANRRVARVLSLSGEKFDVVLVQEKRNKMMPSPFGVAVRSPLRLSGIAAKCGLHTLAAKLDRLLYFPSPAIRFARACVRQ